MLALFFPFPLCSRATCFFAGLPPELSFLSTCQLQTSHAFVDIKLETPFVGTFLWQQLSNDGLFQAAFRLSKQQDPKPKLRRPGRTKRERGKQKSKPELWTQSLVVYIFRGKPDTWNKRHVLLYLESAENPDFHVTLHVQRPIDESDEDKDQDDKKKKKQKRPKKENMKPKQGDGLPWNLYRFYQKVNWADSKTYIKHLHAGFVHVNSQIEEQVADVIASQPPPDHEASDQNCQTWLLGAMRRLVEAGLQTQEWYD